LYGDALTGGLRLLSPDADAPLSPVHAVPGPGWRFGVARWRQMAVPASGSRALRQSENAGRKVMARIVSG
jgi:hypothetical protein